MPLRPASGWMWVPMIPHPGSTPYGLPGHARVSDWKPHHDPVAFGDGARDRVLGVEVTFLDERRVDGGRTEPGPMDRVLHLRHRVDVGGSRGAELDHAAILAATSDINPTASEHRPRYRESMDELTYDEVGATAGDMPPGYHHVRARRVIGHGRETFERAADALLAGEAQRRAGARVELSQTPMQEGTRVTMRLGLGILSFRIPCLVVWAKRSTTTAGFAYGTLPGIPSAGRSGSR